MPRTKRSQRIRRGRLASVSDGLLRTFICAAVNRLSDDHGERVPIAAIHRLLAGLVSREAITRALLDTERSGAIELISSGTEPAPDAEDWIQQGTRGALCWARTAARGGV